MKQSRPQPLLLLRILIDSNYTFKKFVKNHHRIYHSIEIDKQTSAHEDSGKMMKGYMFKVVKKSKNLFKVSLHNNGGYIKLKDSANLKIIKDFRNIKSLSLPFHHSSSKSTKIAILWLLITKRIKALHCQVARWLLSSHSALEYFNKFFRRLKRTKLKSLCIMLSMMGGSYLRPFMSFDEFPTSLKELSLSWTSKQDPILGYQNLNFKAALSRLKELRTFKLFTPIELGTLHLLISSIPEPSKLTCLELSINSEDVYDQESLSQISKCLDGFKALEKLRLIFQNRFDAFKHFKCLEGSLLKYLELEIDISDENQMIPLGSLIGTLQKLQTLKLTLKGVIYCKSLEFHISMFTQISQLPNLQTLEVDVSTYVWPRQKVSGVIEAIRECIEKLPDLRCFSLIHLQGNFSSEAAALLTSLRKKAHKLIKLKINFGNQSLKQSDLRILATLVEEAKFLEVLGLDGLVLTGKEFLERLSRVLSSLKSLHTLTFQKMSGKISFGAFENMMIRALSKRGLETFISDLNPKKNGHAKEQQFKELDLRAVLKSNPKLRVAIVPSSLNFSNVNLHACKWSEN